MPGVKAKGQGSRSMGGFDRSQAEREADSDAEQELERDSPDQYAEDDHDGEEVYGDGDGYDEDDDDKRNATNGAGKIPRERRKIEIKFIQNKARRHITFSKRKHGIMKKAWELSVLTGTQILLLVVSETGLVYTFTTPKLQPLVTQSEGKNLIQACLNAQDTPADVDDGSIGQEPQEPAESTPPSSGPTPDPTLAARQAQVQAAAQAQAQAAQAQAVHVQAQAQAAEVQAAQASAQRQNGTQSPSNAQAAAAQAQAAQALQSAHATQAAMAVSGLPPHLQQLASPGYKVLPPQYAGFQGFSPLPTGMNGHLNAQLAQLGQVGQLDTATLLALKQQQENMMSQGDYAQLLQQYQQLPQPQLPQHQQQQGAGGGTPQQHTSQPGPQPQPPQPQPQRYK